MNIDQDVVAIPAYPYYTIEDAIKIAQAVSDAGGEATEVSRATLAARLEVDASTGTFSQRIASARCYGVIEGRGAVRLTPLGIEYFTTADDSARKVVFLNFLNNPPAFKAMIEMYDGRKLPDEKAVADILSSKVKLPKSWAGRVASIFRRSLETAGVFDASGFVRFAATLERGGATAPPDPPPPVTTPFPTLTLPRNSLARGVPGVTTWTSGPIQVVTPDPISRDEWQKLSNYIGALEPPKVEKP